MLSHLQQFLPDTFDSVEKADTTPHAWFDSGYVFMRLSHDEFGMNLTHFLRKGGTPDPEVDSCTRLHPVEYFTFTLHRHRSQPFDVQRVGRHPAGYEMVECASCQLGFFSDSIGLTMSIHKHFGFLYEN